MSLARTILLGLLCALACGSLSCARGGADLSALHSDRLDARLRAIAHVGQGRDTRAVPHLVDCLEDDQSDVRLFAILALEQITGETMGYVYYAAPAQRRQAVARWRTWLAGPCRRRPARVDRRGGHPVTTCLPPCPVQLRIVSSPAHLPMVRSAVDKLCQMIGFDPATAAGIVLSVDEALTNVIRHAYGMCDHLPIELTLEPLEEPAGLRIQLRDIGQAVDPARLAPHASDADELTPGGLGLLIIRNTMDHVAYEPQPGGGATLTMTKHLKTHEDHSMSYATYNSTVRAVRREGSAAIVEVVGDIDLNRSQEFQSALLTALEPLPGRVVVDLSGVPYMDSSGVASLVKLLGRCRRASVPLALVGLNVRVASVFQVTRLDTVFEILPTVTEAVA